MHDDSAEHAELLEHLSACRRGIADRSLDVYIPLGQTRLNPPVFGHFHVYPELFYQISGAAVFTFPQQEYVLRKHGVLVIPALVSHAERADPREGQRYGNLVAYADNKNCSAHLATEGRDHKTAIAYIEQPVHERTGAMAAYLTDAVAAWERHRAAAPVQPEGANPTPQALGHTVPEAGRLYDALVRSLLDAALCELLLALEDTHGRTDGEATGKDGEVLPRLVTKSRSLVLASLSDMTLSVGLLAEWLHCSPCYLSHLYKSTTGEALSGYINRKRLERAEELLKSTTLSVKEISWTCGFSQESYFIRKFKERFGVTPKAHRRR